MWYIKVWRALNAASPNNSRGSRIVVTTRSEKLVHYLGEFRRCLKLKPLNDEYAWELFCMVAFHGRHCLQDLEQSENEIVSRCSCLNCQPNGWLWPNSKRVGRCWKTTLDGTLMGTTHVKRWRGPPLKLQQIALQSQALLLLLEDFSGFPCKEEQAGSIVDSWWLCGRMWKVISRKTKRGVSQGAC